MKFLHLGGQHCVTSAIAKYQVRQGHSVTVLGTSGGWFLDRLTLDEEALLRAKIELKGGSYDIVCFHQARTLGEICELCGGNGELKKLKRLVESSGAAPVFFSYGADECPVSSREALKQFCGEAPAECFRHVFVGNGSRLEMEKSGLPWSWLPIPVDLEGVPIPEPVKIGRTTSVNIVHVRPLASPQELAVIEQTMRTLKERKYRFSFTSLESTSFPEYPTFRDLLGSCDLLIERVDSSSFGVLALQAMAHGKTVISCNRYAIGESWNNLKFSPVIDSSPENLLRKVEAVVREPLCLKDLSMRSRSYVERYHHGEVVVARMVEAYREILA